MTMSAPEGHPDHCSLCRRRWEETRALAGEEFCERAAEAAKNLTPLTPEAAAILAENPEVSGNGD